MHHLFVLDAFEKLNFKLDSSIRMAFSLAKLGHRISICGIEDLRWVMGESCARSIASDLTFPDGKTATMHQLSAKFDWRLDQFHCIHMRKDPPFDQNYLAATWMLSSAEKRVPILNPPSKLRDFNEKLLIFQFPQFAAPAIACYKSEYFHGFMSEHRTDAIIKPLELFGGSGVEKVAFSGISETELTDILAKQTSGDKIMKIMQPFDTAVFNGEIRAFCVGGKPLAWCLKRPKYPSFLANTAAGAVLEEYLPTAHETKVATDISKSLWAQGIALCGLDLIDGKISEINITSPRLLCPDIAKEAVYYEEIANFVSETYGPA